MAKNRSPETLRRKERVRAAVDLRGVPEGTEGRVMIANGITWPRYWVAFDNGVEMGSLDRKALVRTGEWKQYLVDREVAAARAAAGGSAEGADGGADDAAVAEAGGGATVNGVAVPQLLIDRTKAALDRFGVSR